MKYVRPDPKGHREMPFLPTASSQPGATTGWDSEGQDRRAEWGAGRRPGRGDPSLLLAPPGPRAVEAQGLRLCPPRPPLSCTLAAGTGLASPAPWAPIQHLARDGLSQRWNSYT